MPGNLYCDQTTPWQGVYFFTNTVKCKVGAVLLLHCCVHVIIVVVGIIMIMFSCQHCLWLQKRAIKIGAQKFWPSYHYSSVVQTAMHSNWNLQKLLKSFMRYCNLKFGYNKASVKTTALQI